MPIDPTFQNKNGTFKKGVCPNPGGRPKRTEWDEQLKTKFPIENLSNMMICLLSGIPSRPKDLKALLKTIKDPNARKSFRKFVKNLKGNVDVRTGQSSSLSNKDQLELIKWLVEHQFGKAVQKVESDIRGDIQTRNLKVEFIESPNKDEK